MSITDLVDKMRDAEPDRAEGALAARGMADAVSILSRHFTLQATNVPFLGRGKQNESLSKYIGSRFSIARADLATAMLDRKRQLAAPGGTIAAVSPQNWFFLSGYSAFRKSVLQTMTLDFSLALGEEAWETFGQRGPMTTLSSFTNTTPLERSCHSVLDLTVVPCRNDKIAACSSAPLSKILQKKQVANPDTRISLGSQAAGSLLSSYANSYQ